MSPSLPWRWRCPACGVVRAWSVVAGKPWPECSHGIPQPDPAHPPRLMVPA